MRRLAKPDGMQARILMTADTVGGVWTYALDLAAGLAQQGVGVTLAVLGPAPSPAQHEAAVAIPGLHLVRTGLKLDWTACDPSEIHAAGSVVGALALASRAALVHLNSPSLAPEGELGVPVVGFCHSCLATWWQAAGQGAMPVDFRWRTATLAAGLARCSALLAPSAAFAAATAHAHGVRPMVVHNGRTPPLARQQPHRARFVFTAGRLWDRGKNVAALDQAAALLKAPVAAAGPRTGPNGEAVEFAHLRALGTLTHDPMAGWLSHRPVFASTALYEPFGLSVLEAAQMACPLVLSDIPTFRELWGGAALFVDPRDPPALAAALGQIRRHAHFTLLFHDTHHRAVSDPAAIDGFDLTDYDGVLAFGETLAAVYRRCGWGARAFVWHEAADTTLFHPPAQEAPRHGLVWIGNWGDGERTAELETFLLTPAHDEGLALDVHGVRYPAEALAMLRRHGARYRGWLANARVPEVFARHLATVHVPRRFYVQTLPGIPTIRVFEALACGIPLVSAPWHDAEHLFRPGEDFLTAPDGQAMRRALRAVAADPALRASLVQNGLETIRARHTCTHRAAELLAICHRLATDTPAAQPLSSPQAAS